MDDVTIPADSAASIAYELRARAKGGGVTAGATDLRRWADMLDPPPTSLRDEVERMILQSTDPDPVLAVVRRHVEALLWTKVSDRGAAVLLRDEVLQLLGAGDE